MARIRILPAISRFLGLTVIADIDILTTPITGMTRKVNGRGGTGKTFLKVTDWTGVIFAHTFIILEETVQSIILPNRYYGSRLIILISIG